VYTLRDDGTIHNTRTGRDEYAPVAPEIARLSTGAPSSEREAPREGPAAGAVAGRERHKDEPEVSVSMS
jgi:hypothetical protein